MRRTTVLTTHDIAPPTSDDRQWAVVEIRRDGTLGNKELIRASDAIDAAQKAASARLSADADMTPHLSSDLDSSLGLIQAANGHLHEAARTFHRGLQHRGADGNRDGLAGPLALIEAFQGDLRHAQIHADLALPTESGVDPNPVQHARLARAWIHLERTDIEQCGRELDLVEPMDDSDHRSWFATAHALLQARLLVATQQPDAASRLLAAATTKTQERTSWGDGILAAAHAEALLAAGESQRALATLTPLPDDARAEAAVVTAAGRQAIGDSRGAGAVLRSVVDALERAPLGLQIRSWILEARIAAKHGQRLRCRSLVDRALRAATPDGLRAPLLWDEHWLRSYLDQEPALLHAHRAFLLGFRPSHTRQDPLGSLRSVEQTVIPTTPTAALTERESQVLELLAQMYSTEEIATTLYVSANTVKTHVKGIFAKLGVNRRVDAVRRGRQLGLI